MTYLGVWCGDGDLTFRWLKALSHDTSDCKKPGVFSALRLKINDTAMLTVSCCSSERYSQGFSEVCMNSDVLFCVHREVNEALPGEIGKSRFPFVSKPERFNGQPTSCRPAPQRTTAWLPELESSPRRHPVVSRLSFLGVLSSHARWTPRY